MSVNKIAKFLISSHVFLYLTLLTIESLLVFVTLITIKIVACATIINKSEIPAGNNSVFTIKNNLSESELFEYRSCIIMLLKCYFSCLLSVPTGLFCTPAKLCPLDIKLFIVFYIRILSSHFC